MASSPEQSDGAPDLTRRRRPSVSRNHPASPTQRQREDLRAFRRDRGHGSRKQSPTMGRAMRNVENFDTNRAHGVDGADASPSTTQDSTARTDTEQTDQTDQEEPDSEVEPAQSNAEYQQNGQFGDWKPSIVIGSPLWLSGEDLSAIEIADRKVAQTGLWADHYGGPEFAQMHQEAIEKREQLDETAEINTTPRSTLPSLHARVIQQRIDLLRSVLEDSTFPPEHANIEAAIAAYKSGAITCSDSYTLIWAGRIVDRCPDYESFSTDRSARLDRYLAAHGPGWLWYEPPLSPGDPGGGTILAKKGICLENKTDWRLQTENMGHFRIQMSFRRRKQHTSRQQPTPFASPPPPPPPPSNNNPKKRRRSITRPSGKSSFTPNPFSPTRPAPIPTQPDPDGPRLFYETLLDTGATLPCIFVSDLAPLRITTSTYAAQSARAISTAERTIPARVYELDVGIHHPHSHNTHPQPEEPNQILGATLPVVTLPGRAKSDFDADLTPDRLSGILPFHVCYTSSAPGAHKLWLGASRRDVLGAGRFPGGMGKTGWWYPHVALEREMETEDEDQDQDEICNDMDGEDGDWEGEEGRQRGWMEKELGTPRRVIFEHDYVGADGTGRVLLDEDTGMGSMVLTAPGGTMTETMDTNGEDVDVVRIMPATGVPLPGRKVARQPQRKRVKRTL